MKIRQISALLGIVIVLTVLSVNIVNAERVGSVPEESISSQSINIMATGLSTDSTPTKEELVATLLGGGISVSNVQFTGANVARGKFSGGTGIIGFEDGIILSSGDIKNVIGPNKYDSVTKDNGLPGDSQLTALIPGYQTYDAAVLEFDFIPDANYIQFNYVFSSDEYNEYVNSQYNDVFGFFINDQNIAVIPYTATPVAINNVNCGGPVYGTNPSNCGYYRNNDLNDGGGSINTEMDGLTNVFTAFAKVNAHQTNHIKLAIADAGDYILDSNVFIEANSFVSKSHLTLEPLSDTNIVGETHTLTAKLLDDFGNPANGETITFTVTAGPHAGTSGTSTTDINGIATWSYTGTNVGTDTIITTGYDLTSNEATKNWKTIPAAIPGGPYTGFEGSSIAFDGSTSSDQGGFLVTYAWDFGDGDTGSGSKPMHTYADNGAYTVTLTVTDNFGTSDVDSTTATVANVPPTVGSITVIPNVVEINKPISTSALFTDPGILDTHTALWTWDDTTTSPGIVTEAGGNGNVEGSHTYTATGIYTVKLDVTDKDGGVGSSIYQFVVVYDPNDGFVTGGGWIDSPAGAYPSDKTLTGQANFGFVSKYKTGASVPMGQTEFQFHAGDLNFHSESYQWLVVAGAKAQFKGTGTINGAGNYGFLLTATDGAINGGGGVDKFRIKILDETTSTVVYDNALGASEDIELANPQAISGGSIVIHKV